MRTNLKGDRYDTMAAEILESVAVRVDLHPLRGHQRQNLQDAIASRLRYEIEGAADQRTSVTESLLAAERERAEIAEREADRLGWQGRDTVQLLNEAQERAEKAEAALQPFIRFNIDPWGPEDDDAILLGADVGVGPGPETFLTLGAFRRAKALYGRQ